MKRTFVITVLLMLLLATVGTTAAVAVKPEKTPQAGKSSTYLFDVATTDAHRSGTLMINLDEHKFVFNGKGFEPGKPYRLWYSEGATGGLPEMIHPFVAAVANNAGNVHCEGAWTEALDSWPAPAFTIKPDVKAGSGSSTVYTGLITGDGTEEGWGHYYVFVTPDGTTHRIYQGQTGPDSLPTGSHATFTVEAIRTNADHTVVVASGPVVVTSSDPPGTWSWYADMKPA
ncbi:MAG: hypothetical protein ACXVIE_08560 [Halobacteriota archaeon]